MTFLEAMKALSEGKKVTNKYWTKLYIYSKEGYLKYSDQGDAVRELNFINSSDWEIIEEPKKKKRYWVWSLNDGDHWWKESSYYNDGGIGTDGHKVYVQWDSLEKIKHENEFIEV